MFIWARPAARLTSYPFPHTPGLVKAQQLKLKVNAAVGLLITNRARKREGVRVAGTVGTACQSEGDGELKASSESLTRVQPPASPNYGDGNHYF